MNFHQPKFKKIKESLLDVSKIAAEHLFLTSLVLISVSLLLGSAIFYKYYILPQKIEPELGREIIKFQENTYQKILDEWQGRGERFEAVKTKEYPDSFKP